MLRKSKYVANLKGTEELRCMGINLDLDLYLKQECIRQI